LVNDSEYSQSKGAKPIPSPSCIYLVSPGANAEAGEANLSFPLRSRISCLLLLLLQIKKEKIDKDKKREKEKKKKKKK
jgi:hypothetical protein